MFQIGETVKITVGKLKGERGTVGQAPGEKKPRPNDYPDPVWVIFVRLPAQFVSAKKLEKVPTSAKSGGYIDSEEANKWLRRLLQEDDTGGEVDFRRDVLVFSSTKGGCYSPLRGEKRPFLWYLSPLFDFATSIEDDETPNK